MGEEILPLQQACYREHNSLVFLPRCTLSLLSVCTAYLLLQSLTILVGPEINWNKSKMKYELKCQGGGATAVEEWTRAQTAVLWRTVDRLVAIIQGTPSVSSEENQSAVRVWFLPVFHHCFCRLINTLCPRLLIPSKIKDLTPSLCIR